MFTALNLDTTSDTAGFRLWGKAISDAIAAQGWVKTADTGQIDWATVTTSAASTSYGYEIWRAADTLAATYPIFLKLEYGTGAKSSAPWCPQVWATVGMASNGAGTLIAHGSYTSAISSRNSFLSSSSTAVNHSGMCYVNGDGSSLVLALWPPSNADTVSGYTRMGGGVLVLERTRDEDGTANNRGFCTHWAFTGDSGGNAAMKSQVFKFSTSAQPTQLSYGQGEPLPMGSCKSGSGGWPQKIRTGTLPQIMGPHAYMLAVPNEDYAAHTSYRVTHLGQTGLWRALGRGNGTASGSNSSWSGWGSPHYASAFSANARGSLLIKE